MHRNRLSIAVSLVVLWIPAGGCQSDAADEQAELQALLHDEPLQQVPPGAASTMGVSTAALAVAPGDASSGPPIGLWKFDDCSSFSTRLVDLSFHDNTAFRAVNAACVPGAGGLGVAIAATEDIVYVPDQPTFTFEAGVTVGGWFKPVTVNGTRTLIRKRDRDTSSFALVLNGGKYQFVASFGSGRAASVTAPTRARAGVFQHVVGTYDGTTLRLYIDGTEVTSFAVAGTIPIGAGPLLMGNDGSERRFNGTLDNITFATHALTAAEVLLLTCLPQQPTLTVPSELPVVPAGTPVLIDVALTNNNSLLGCAPITFNVEPFLSGLLLDPPDGTQTDVEVASGETIHFPITATAPHSADPGARFNINLSVFEQTTQFFGFEILPFVVADATGCHVTTSHELMITDVSVVDDPVRTTFDPTSSDPRNGAWTFKRVMENMAASPDDAPAMVQAMLTSFNTDQTINGFTVAKRPGMARQVLADWPRTPDGKLDLAQAPLRLQAIVNRFDLRNLAHGDAGEGRFVFAFYRTDGFQLEATMILEYKLPAATDDDVLGWAQSFHALGALSFGEDYNAALQAITDRFAGRGARPGHPNDSAVNTVRTNELSFASNDNFMWELRQFTLSATSGRLEPSTVDLTPDRSFNNSDTLAAYINANREAIIAETHVVPAVFNGQSFAAGAIFNNLGTWFAPGVDNEVRHHFALNTCNGCHSREENGVFFLQIAPRNPGREAQLSRFLTGMIINDPVTGARRTLDDLGRRKLDLEPIVCPGQGARVTTTLRKGISRVH